jgi:hypothetical protein
MLLTVLKEVYAAYDAGLEVEEEARRMRTPITITPESFYSR